MVFEDMETSVVDVLRAQEVQRLRRIRQLGLTHIVYPGAEHTRFIHAVGCSYLAARFAKRLSQEGRDFLSPLLLPGATTIRDFALAALCHDLGHGPLSHIWEKHVIGSDFNRTLWITSLGLEFDKTKLLHLKWHEIVTQALLAWQDGELHQLLERQEMGATARLRRLLLGEYHPTYLPRLINSDVDVDRSDYILRDAHQTGVAYGRYDLGWLISALTIGETSDGRLVVAFDKRKGPPVIEQFLVARRALYHSVYFHKTVRAIEAVLALLIKRIKDTPSVLDHKNIKMPIFEPYIKILKGEALTPSQILFLDDYSLWSLIQAIATSTDIDRTTGDLARRIIYRDLFKIVPCQIDSLQKFIIREDAYERLYDAVGPYCQGDPSYYVYIDRAEFEMLCDDERQRAYFADTENSNRLAIPIREHERIKLYWTGKEIIVRLFVPREAVDSAYKLIEAT